MAIEDAAKWYVAERVAEFTDIPPDVVAEDIESRPNWREWLTELLADGIDCAVDAVYETASRRWREIQWERGKEMRREIVYAIEGYFARHGLVRSEEGLWHKPGCKYRWRSIMVTDDASINPGKLEDVIFVGDFDKRPPFECSIVSADSKTQWMFKAAQLAVWKLDAACRDCIYAQRCGTEEA